MSRQRMGRGSFALLVLLVSSCLDGSLPVADGTLNVLDEECWNENFLAICDPRSPEACSSDTSCALAYEPSIAVACSGPLPIGDLGAACDASSGCKPTLMCDHGVCRQACCSDADCDAGQSCGTFHAQLGRLGTCSP